MADATYPEDLRYHAAHDWAGAKIHAGDGYGELESVKAVSDVVAPLAGEVLEINQAVVDSPESVNSDPYGAWLVKVKLDDPSAFDELLSADAYRSLL
jgi:glycine cleavage system H protein